MTPLDRALDRAPSRKLHAVKLLHIDTMQDEQLDLIFKALADSTRRRIIDHLSRHEAQSLFEVCAASVAEDGVALSRQTVSQHLSVIEKAGLIETTWKGRTKAHSLRITEDHTAAASWLANYKEKEPTI
ncbi:winged helix-turn-helix domain-containing protein [Tropicimonas sp. TH_r6]|uniref:ArsR/SmtB family transcription factor n=1 Tax=Tropicimonas sp. TH_r6 TaxID=3082085 RepID=UPI00295385D3|nr:winged helix-turn-helix domain-containing protein [Tropicimonas sp. TH_r6]MDV7144147.1 winged helix-turn-helix domain-containing protein [Tropicimonas sp. TH_r6]